MSEESKYFYLATAIFFAVLIIAYLLAGVKYG